jgi:hypothetical protein
MASSLLRKRGPRGRLRELVSELRGGRVLLRLAPFPNLQRVIPAYTRGEGCGYQWKVSWVVSQHTRADADRYFARWVREGLYKFSFELRKCVVLSFWSRLVLTPYPLSVGKSTLFNMKEACDHSFSYKTGNYLYLLLHGRASRTRTPRFTEYGLPHALPQNRPPVTVELPFM